jgi:hypothetical protein
MDLACISREVVFPNFSFAFCVRLEVFACYGVSSRHMCSEHPRGATRWVNLA